MGRIIENPGLYRLEIRDGILFSDISQGSEYNLERARMLIDDYIELSGGKKIPICHDMCGIKSTTADAMKYVSSDKAASVIKALGMINNSPISRVIGNLFMGLRKPPYPAKIFGNQEDTLKWLEQFKE